MQERNLQSLLFICLVQFIGPDQEKCHIQYYISQKAVIMKSYRPTCELLIGWFGQLSSCTHVWTSNSCDLQQVI